MKFNKSQVVFFIKYTLIGVLDRIESGLPTSCDWKDRKEYGRADDPLSLSEYERGALESAGMAIACFYANIADDGMGIYDALASCSNFDTMIETLVRESWKDEGKSIKVVSGQTIDSAYGDLWPNVDQIASTFVEEYLLSFVMDDLPTMPVQHNEPVVHRCMRCGCTSTVEDDLASHPAYGC
jgi:hypothetical protein